MVNQSASDKWKRWPAFPETDAIQDSAVHLIMVESDDIGRAFADNIDNNDNGEEGSPIITQEIINQAANDAPYFRYQVPNALDKYGKPVILYDAVSSGSKNYMSLASELLLRNSTLITEN